MLDPLDFILSTTETTTKVCMVSGKGGCGKTTTSLILSKMLSHIGKKVLLIDCDLATHGASCFLHKLINNNNLKYSNIACIDRIVRKTDSDDNDFELIGNNEDDLSKIAYLADIYFIPYNISQKEEKPIVPYTNTLNNITTKYLEGKFDVIIFDCQAGYSPFAVDLVNICDKIIFMSSDDLSSATATELLSNRLVPLTMEKQNFVIRNKWFDVKEKRHKNNNDLMQYTEPIMFNEEVGTVFSANEFDDMVLPDKPILPLKYLLDILSVASKCFPECEHEFNYMKQISERKFFFRKVRIAILILSILLVPIILSIVLHT